MMCFDTVSFLVLVRGVIEFLGSERLLFSSNLENFAGYFFKYLFCPPPLSFRVFNYLYVRLLEIVL